MNALVSIVAVLAVSFGVNCQDTASEATLCDAFSSTYLLHCASPLLYSARYQLNPRITGAQASADILFSNDPDGNRTTSDLGATTADDQPETRSDVEGGAEVCSLYADYKLCAPFDLRRRCRSLISHVESIYEFVCASDIKSNLTAKSACVAKLDADRSVIDCERRAAIALRNLAAVDGLSIDRRRSMQCDVVQQYVDCVRPKYTQECGEQIWLIKGEVTRLATAIDNVYCNLSLVEPAIDYSKPICEANQQCNCHPGYEFDSQKSDVCVDSDECAQSTALCSQKCSNTVGSYKCSCDERYYQLSSDGLVCSPKAHEGQPWIFFAHGQSLWNISIDGKDFQLKRAGLQKTAMIDIDESDKMIYYVDIGSNKLERIKYEGVFPQTLQSYDLQGTEGLAVDWIGRNLYTVKGTNMFVQQLEGRYRKTLYSDVFKLPRALAVNSLIGYAFASDWGANAFIARASMDGKDFRRIITTGLVWPNGLALDYFGEKIYWADAFLDIIECSRFDGTQRKTVLHDANTVPHPFGLAIMNDYIYWTDWTYRGILRAGKNNGENVTVVAQTALLPYSIKISYPAVQPKGDNPCGNNNGGCSQLCLLSPESFDNSSQSARLNYTCACANGFQLDDADGHTCVSRCSNKELHCQGSDPKCISRIYVCDGIRHCEDNADEKDCPPRLCPTNQFQCQDKTCIESTKVCDGSKTCEDGSDEMYC